MYAVILNGGKQYRIQKGDTVKLEYIPEEVGSSVNLGNVCMVADGDSIQIGKPYLEGCKVSGTVISQGRHKKIKIIKFRRRKHHEKWQGHRQNYTEIKIEDIQI